MGNKLKSYDKATENLMRQAMNLDVQTSGRFSLPEMVFLLRNAFKQSLTYRRVFSDDPIGLKRGDPSEGFCLVSSYYIYEHTGGDQVWRIMKSPLHWWLEHKQTGAVFDVTYTQFNEPFPYSVGTVEQRIENDALFADVLRTKSAILGRYAGME